MRSSSFFARAALAFALAALGTGCYGSTYGRYHHHHHGHGDGVLAAAAVGLVAGAALAASTEHREPEREREPVYVQSVVYVNGAPPAPLPASPRDRVEAAPSAASFDARQARTALAGVDLSSCRAAGAPRGYGHAKVTFNPDGSSSKVVVDTPSGLSAPAAQCIGDHLGTVTVPPFQGSLVTVGTTWFVP